MQINLAAHHFVFRKTGLESVFLIVEIELEWKNVAAAALQFAMSLIYRENHNEEGNIDGVNIVSVRRTGGSYGRASIAAG